MYRVILLVKLYDTWCIMDIYLSYKDYDIIYRFKKVCIKLNNFKNNY